TYYNGIASAFPDVTVNPIKDVRAADPHLAETDVLIAFGPHLRDRADHGLGAAKRLKWFQALGTGVDNIADRAHFPRQVILTNILGIHGACISEGALMAMLNRSRHTPRYFRNQDRHAWERWRCRLIEGKTVGIFGIGAIAQVLAPRCGAMGM